MRTATIRRKTFETDIKLTLNIDGEGKEKVDTGVGFLNHMLTLMTGHGFLDLDLKCDGDVEVDDHHSVEDAGIVLGQAFKEALGTKEGIKRYATAYTPMDESLSLVSIDISGRPYLHFEATFPTAKVGNFDTELVEEFFRGFVNQAGVTVHIKLLHGKNSHHMIESIFKGFGRVLDEATRFDDRIQGILSTKGLL